MKKSRISGRAWTLSMLAFGAGGCGFFHKESFVPVLEDESTQVKVSAESRSSQSEDLVQNPFLLEVLNMVADGATVNAQELRFATRATMPGLSDFAEKYSLPDAETRVTVLGPGGQIFDGTKPGGQFNWSVPLPEEGDYDIVVSLKHPDAELSRFNSEQRFRIVRDTEVPVIVSRIWVETDVQAGVRNVRGEFQVEDLTEPICEPIRILDLRNPDIELARSASLTLERLELTSAKGAAFWSLRAENLLIPDSAVDRLGAEVTCADRAGNSKKALLALDEELIDLQLRVQPDFRVHSVEGRSRGYAPSGSLALTLELLSVEEGSAPFPISGGTLEREVPVNFVYLSYEDFEVPVARELLDEARIGRVSLVPQVFFPLPANLDEGVPHSLYVLHSRWNREHGTEEFYQKQSFEFFLDTSAPSITLHPEMKTNAETGVREVFVDIEVKDQTSVSCGPVEILALDQVGVPDAQVFASEPVLLAQAEGVMLSTEWVASTVEPARLEVAADAPLDLSLMVTCEDLIGNKTTEARGIADDAVPLGLRSVLNSEEVQLIGQSDGTVKVVKGTQVTLQHTLVDPSSMKNVAQSVLERERSKLLIYVSQERMYLPIDPADHEKKVWSRTSFSESTTFEFPGTWVGEQTIHVMLTRLSHGKDGEVHETFVDWLPLSFYVDPVGGQVTWLPRKPQPFEAGPDGKLKMDFEAVVRADGVPVTELGIEYSTDGSSWMVLEKEDYSISIGPESSWLNTSVLIELQVSYPLEIESGISDIRFRVAATDAAANVSRSGASPLAFLSQDYSIAKDSSVPSDCQDNQSNIVVRLASPFLCKTSSGKQKALIGFLNKGNAPLRLAGTDGNTYGYQVISRTSEIESTKDQFFMRADRMVSLEPASFEQFMLIDASDDQISRMEFRYVFDVKTGLSGTGEPFSSAEGSTCGENQRPQLALHEMSDTFIKSGFRCDELQIPAVGVE